MLGISLIINIKLHLTSQLQSLLKVTTASVTSSQYPRYQEIALYSNSSSQPQTPANHSPLWTAQTQSHHTFFFLNIVKSNTSPSCTRPTCQTMLRDCSVVHFAGSEERKAKDVKSYSLKCKQLSTFSFNSHSHYRSSRHVQQDIHMIPELSKKRAHCQQVTFSLWPQLAWEVTAVMQLWHQRLSVLVDGDRRNWKRSSGGPSIICQEELHQNLNECCLLGPELTNSMHSQLMAYSDFEYCSLPCGINYC